MIKVCVIPCGPCYMNSTLMHGLLHFQKQGKLEVDFLFDIPWMYDGVEINEEELPKCKPHKTHFTLYYDLDKKDYKKPDSELIYKKLYDKYYDCVFTGEINQDNDVMHPHVNYNKLVEIHNIYKEKFVIVDGSDGVTIDQYIPILEKDFPSAFVFKRDLIHMQNWRRLAPTSYGYPDMYVNDNKLKKEKTVSSILPAFYDTYVLGDREEYFREYKVSNFAFTWRKCGFDCARHTQIIFNRCIPFMPDLIQDSGMPLMPLHHYPLNLIKKAMFQCFEIDATKWVNYKETVHNEFWPYGKTGTRNNYLRLMIDIGAFKIRSLQYYDELEEEIYQYAKRNLTCSKVVENMLRIVI